MQKAPRAVEGSNKTSIIKCPLSFQLNAGYAGHVVLPEFC